MVNVDIDRCEAQVLVTLKHKLATLKITCLFSDSFLVPFGTADAP